MPLYIWQAVAIWLKPSAFQEIPVTDHSIESTQADSRNASRPSSHERPHVFVGTAPCPDDGPVSRSRRHRVLSGTRIGDLMCGTPLGMKSYSDTINLKRYSPGAPELAPTVQIPHALHSSYIRSLHPPVAAVQAGSWVGSSLEVCQHQELIILLWTVLGCVAGQKMMRGQRLHPSAEHGSLHAIPLLLDLHVIAQIRQ